MPSVKEDQIMIDQQYRQDFELACKKLGEKYGDRWNKVLSQIKQNRKNAEHNRNVDNLYKILVPDAPK
jgi:hypothetical protein